MEVRFFLLAISLQKGVIVWKTNIPLFGTHSNFFQDNEKIWNASNAFKMHHKLAGTGESVYRTANDDNLNGEFPVCLLEVFRPTRVFFTHIETSPLPVKAYARHSWPLSSEVSLAYCDKGHLFMTIISGDPWQTLHCRAFSSGAVTSWLFLLRSVAAGIRTLNLPQYYDIHNNSYL